MKNLKLVGEQHIAKDFYIKSGAVKIGDPCYSPATWCLGECDDVMDGKWATRYLRANIKNWGNRNTALFAFNKEYFESKYNHNDIDLRWFINSGYRNTYCLDYISSGLTVDGGQAGIFDSQNFIAKKTGDQEEEKVWFFDTVSRISLHEPYAGSTYDHLGCVSESGYGDGFYDYYCFYDKDGFTVAILIVFISERNKEEEE